MGKSKTNAIKRTSMSRLRFMGLDADMITLARVLLGMQGMGSSHIPSVICCGPSEGNFPEALGSYCV